MSSLVLLLPFPAAHCILLPSYRCQGDCLGARQNLPGLYGIQHRPKQTTAQGGPHSVNNPVCTGCSRGNTSSARGNSSNRLQGVPEFHNPRAFLQRCAVALDVCFICCCRRLRCGQQRWLHLLDSAAALPQCSSCCSSGRSSRSSSSRGGGSAPGRCLSSRGCSPCLLLLLPCLK